jgi:cell division protein FtsB
MSLKKLVFFAVIVVSLFVINSFIHSIYNLWQKNDLLVRAKQDLENEKKENKELKKKLTEVKKPGFVEEEARNKLFLAKPGEGIVIIPTDVLSTTSSTKKPLDTRSNWQKWWDLFFTRTP